MKKHWYDYLWIWTILYFALGFFNILFAWLGMIDFLVPLMLLHSRPNSNLSRIREQILNDGSLLASLLNVKKVLARNPTVLNSLVPALRILSLSNDNIETVVSQVK